MDISGLRSNICTRNATFSIRSCEGQTGDHQNNTSKNPGGCLAAAPGDIHRKFKLADIRNDSSADTNENTHTPETKQRNDRITNVAVKGNLTSISRTAMEQFGENQLRSEPVFCFYNYHNGQNDPEKSNDITAEI